MDQKKVKVIHKCEEMDGSNNNVPHGNGPAITDIEYMEGIGWKAHNDEYSTFIHFCPFCGLDLEKVDPQMDLKAVIV